MIDGLGHNLCDAIAKHRLIEFDYNGVHRRAIEIDGRSPPFGKLWTVAKMQDLPVMEQPFTPNDPDYNPNDTAMVTIQCRVER